MEDHSLFEVAAQVIPVLFFAMLFQLDGFRDSEGKSSPRTEWFLFAIIIVAAAAEFICISVLAEDSKPTEFEKIVVSIAITFLFLPAIVRAAAPRVEAIGKAHPWSNGLGFLAILLGGLGLVGLSVAQVPLAPVLAVVTFIFPFGRAHLRWAR